MAKPDIDRYIKSRFLHFIDPATGGPLPGREENWSLVTEYRVHLAQSERSWAEAERLQRIRVDWDRKGARPALETAPGKWDDRQRYAIRMLAGSFHNLAEIQREKGDPACAGAYREAFDLANAIGDTAAQAVCAFNLGNAYSRIADLRDLDEAERWLRKSLDLQAPGDALGSGKSLTSLGAVFIERCNDAQAAKRPVEELAGFLAEAVRLNEQALEMYPKTAITDRGIAHNQLGTIYNGAGDIDRALHHYRQDIRYCEEAGDLFGAGQTRYNVARALRDAGRLEDARAYAEAALANFQNFGERAAADIQDTERLIAEIDMAAAEKRGSG